MKLNRLNKISLIIGIIIGLSTIVGVGFKVDSYYAHAEDIKVLSEKLEYTNQRLEYKILTDKIYQQTKMKWALQDRINQYPNDNKLKEQLNEVNFSLKELEKIKDSQ